MRSIRIMAAALLLAPAADAAPTVSLNGIPIDGVTGQRFDNVTVVIDDRGNVNILARGYTVSRAEGEAAAAASVPVAALPARPPMSTPAPTAASSPPGAAPPAPSLGRRYFLVAEQAEPGAVEYDVSVFLNGRWVREVRSDGDAAPFEVTRFLQPGPNRVTLVATKRIAGAVRRSTSKEQTLRVLIGEGTAAGGTAHVSEPLVSMTRNAAETDTFTEEHDLVAR